MKVLVLGNGAREHAIVDALYRSEKKPEIVCFANARNPGIASLAKRMEVGNLQDFDHLKAFAKEEQPNFAVLGPDDPIAAGAADALLEIGIKSIGPTKKLAQLESSKSFTRDLLDTYGIPGNPKFKVFTSTEGMREFCEECGQIVVKYDGLAGGKGVQVQGDHFTSIEEGISYAQECIEKLGKVVIEEKLVGQEFSYLFFVDGKSAVPMPAVQDNKRAFEGDKGPNTGGMGTVSDSDHSLPFLIPEDLEQAKEISTQVVGALQNECGENFCGILFGGFIATPKGVRLIEYNVRFGDPEALNLLPILSTDFVEICEAMLEQRLEEIDIEFFYQATVCKYVVPEGYPEKAVKGETIQFDEKNIPVGVKTYFASVDEVDNQLILKGSRAIGFTGIADTIEEAEEKAEKATRAVNGRVFHRTDIGTLKLLGERTAMMRMMRGGLG